MGQSVTKDINDPTAQIKTDNNESSTSVAAKKAAAFNERRLIEVYANDIERELAHRYHILVPIVAYSLASMVMFFRDMATDPKVIHRPQHPSDKIVSDIFLPKVAALADDTKLTKRPEILVDHVWAIGDAGRTSRRSPPAPTGRVTAQNSPTTILARLRRPKKRRLFFASSSTAWRPSIPSN